MSNGKLDPHEAIFDQLGRGEEPDSTKAAERYIAGLPGVGAGMLDTLRVLYGKPLQFDTATTGASTYGQFFPGDKASMARVVLNPVAMENSVERVRLSPTGPTRAFAIQPALTLAHEVLGHGVEGVGGSRAGEHRAEAIARSFVRQTGRSNLPFRDPGEMMSEGTMRRLLKRLQKER